MNELQRFERAMLDEIQAYQDGKPWAPRRKAPEAAVNRQATVVRLAVREKRLGMDVEFVHHSPKLSTLEAKLDAERAARKAGYPIVGYVIDVEQAEGGAS